MAEKEVQKQEIPAMYGDFNVRGKVEVLNKENFISQTKNQKERRSLTIGLRTAKNNLIYIAMNGFEQNEVYFVKRDEETKKSETKVIPWSDRLDFDMEGFAPMSRVDIGVEQTVTADGKKENVRHTLIMFDALKEIYDHVNVGDELRIRGNVSVESYKDKNGETKNSVRLNPSAIYKLVSPLDFDAEDFAETNVMNQTIIANDIEIDEKTNRGVISGKVIGNKRTGVIEITVLEDKTNELKMIQRRVQEYPFMAFRVQARIANESNATPVEEVSDFWGFATKTEKRESSRTIYQYVGIVNDSQDIDTYTEENIKEFEDTFCRGQEEFGANSVSGNKGSENDLWGNI